ncbi:uncharacterized protein [Lepeophtheirus salmonis]|uniref:uncharacterized protein n=1 Tax=Lepeophtheirus salmonis TaxID=72036 RepID=UPI001AE479DA|nr:uncharacterized protein LOC121124388 [Lepeophtheirus salmonis]
MEISFLVAYSFSDAQKPRIRSVAQSSVEIQCSDIEECDSKTWKAIFLISDSESGIRSIQTDPYINFNSGSRRFIYNEFIFGDPNEEVRFVMSGNCCEKELSVTVQDGFGNAESLSLLPLRDGGSSSSNMGLNGLEIAIIVVSIILFVVIIGIITAVVFIRQRNAESVNEMRRFPSPAERA